MGIDEIEFHNSYHQNLGTFQAAWLFHNFLLAKILPTHPLVKSHLTNTIGNPFFVTLGSECIPSHEDNSWRESVAQVESVEKIMKNLKTGKVTKILRNNNLLTVGYFSEFW